MKIVIVGGGKVGFAIAREVSAEGHDVTIIDSSRAVCDRLSLALDGMTVQGNGAALDVQHAALVPESDLLIAASPNDEANILACMLARKLGCANTIARIRSRSYLDGVQLLREELGLSMAVTPDLYAAREIFRQLQLPLFSGGNRLPNPVPRSWRWRSMRIISSAGKSSWSCRVSCATACSCAPSAAGRRRSSRTARLRSGPGTRYI